VRLEKARAQLAGRVSLRVAWRPFEIHPDVPAAGLPLSSLGYPPENFAAMMRNLRRVAVAEGIEFVERSPDSLLANTHRALAASAYAQSEEPERFEAFHHALFRANFAEGQNVGDAGVLGTIAAACGLDVARLEAALGAGTYDPVLRDASAEACRRGITAVPAFVFGDRHVVIGAHPAETLRQTAEDTLAGR